MKSVWLLLWLSSTAMASELRVPAPPGSMAPQLTRSKSGLILSWLEPGKKEGEFKLRWSAWKPGSHGNQENWSHPQWLPMQSQLFANSADRPSVFMNEGALFAHGLAKVPGAEFAYDVVLSSSTDQGATWKEWGAIRKNRDPRKPSYDGFMSFVSDGKAARLLWIDGRDDDGKESLMSLRAANFDPNKGVTDESVLDPDICACCRPMAVTTDEGPVFFYRGHASGEVRDIQWVRRQGNGWSKPLRVHEDGWKIKGCPMNGPHADARGKWVVVSWFTMGSGRAEVLSAISKDGARSFGRPVTLDSPSLHSPRGYVQTQILDEDRALVLWVVKNEKSETEIRGRVIFKSGKLGETRALVKLGAHQEMSYPQAGFSSGKLLLIWAQSEQVDGKKVRSIQGVIQNDFGSSTQGSSSTRLTQ